MSALFPGAGLNSPALMYKTIDYTDLLTDPFVDSQLWTDLTESMTTLFDGVVHYAADQLYYMRSAENDPIFVAYNTRMLGFQVPLNSFSNTQYVNLLQSLGTFYQTAGASIQFLNFLAYIENTSFTFLPLWANSTTESILNLTDTPGTPVWEGGTYFPTPFYDLEYSEADYPNLDVQQFVNLLYQISPIYLVPRSLAFLSVTTAQYSIMPVVYETSNDRATAKWPA
jgi:hypothetical protein